MRTIVISLASSAAYRNLFFFPESFFAQLRERLHADQNLRVVVAVPQNLKEKYAPFLTDVEAGERLVAVYTKVSPPKKFGQRLFYFLYSYLVYTGTTRIMATMGTRPDEPPAGGRWYLAPLKIAIARIAGYSKFLKRRVVPALWLRIFTDRPFADLFDRFQPDTVFLSHLYGWFDTVLLAEAKRRGVYSIGMPAGWDHLDKYFLPFHTDRLLVGSEQVARMALTHQAYEQSRISIVGYPHFDFIARRQFLTSRDVVLQRLGFPLGSQYFLYVSGSAYCPDEPDIIEKILLWADEGKFGTDVRLVIRPYQGGRGQDKQFDMEKFRRFSEHPRVVVYQREFWGNIAESNDFMNILGQADAVLALYSTMVVEAAVLDRPLIAPAFDGYTRRPYSRSIRRFMGFDHFREVLETGGLRIVLSFDELYEALDRYLKDPKQDADKRELLRQKVCGVLDTHASKRILDAVLGIYNAPR